MSQEHDDAKKKYYLLRGECDRAFQKALQLANYGTLVEAQAARCQYEELSKQLYAARKELNTLVEREDLDELIETFKPFAKSDEAAREIAKLVYERYE